MGKLEIMKQKLLLAYIVGDKAQIVVGNELPRVAESDIVFRSPPCGYNSRLAITSKGELKKQLYQCLADFDLLCYYVVAKEEVIVCTEECDIHVIEVIIDGETVAIFDKKTGEYVKKIKECSV